MTVPNPSRSWRVGGGPVVLPDADEPEVYWRQCHLCHKTKSGRNEMRVDYEMAFHYDRRHRGWTASLALPSKRVYSSRPAPTPTPTTSAASPASTAGGGSKKAAMDERMRRLEASDPFTYYVHKEQGTLAVAVRDSYGKWSYLTEDGAHGYTDDDSFWHAYVSVDVCFTAEPTVAPDPTDRRSSRTQRRE